MHTLYTSGVSTSSSTERLSSISLNEEAREEATLEQEEQENFSDDDFSLVNLSSSLILNFLYDDEESEHMLFTESETSIESHFSAVVLNEEYEDHLYNADKPEIGYGEADKRPSRREYL